MKKSFIVCLFSLIVVLCCAIAYCTPEEAVKARAVGNAFGDAVVSVQVVYEQSYSYEGQSDKRQTKSTATASVVDSSGLIVTALSAIDAASQLPFPDDSSFKFNSKLIDAKVKFADGDDVTYDIVLKDKDLDIVFLRPQKPLEKAVKFINMAEAAIPQSGDDVVTLERLGQVAGRALALGGDMIRSVVSRPRLFYVIFGSSKMGLPCFDMNAKPLGISVIRFGVKASSMDDMGTMSNETLMVIMPCSTIVNLIDQAKTIKVKAEPATPPVTKAPPKPAPAKPTKPVK